MSSKSKSKRYCSVPQCSTYKSKEISIHSFPKDERLCEEWKIALKIGKPITVGMSVCSQHFREEDFTIITPHTKIKRLKKGVIPSKRLPITSHDGTIKKNNFIQRTWLNKNAVTSRSDAERENIKEIEDRSVELSEESELAMDKIVKGSNNENVSVSSELYRVIHYILPPP